jgi:sec-independent protein translocase protein TatA
MGPPEIIIGLVIILVLFGGSQIPKLARNLGKAQQEFKTGLSEGQVEGQGEGEASTGQTGTSTTTTKTTVVDPNDPTTKKP